MKSRAILAAATLSATSFMAGCGGRAEVQLSSKLPETEALTESQIGELAVTATLTPTPMPSLRELPETTAVPEALSPEQTKELNIRERMYELVVQGLQEVREKFEEKHQIKVLKNVCIGWESLAGYTLTINPGWYIYNENGETFTMAVFSSNDNLSNKFEGPDMTEVILMDGAYQYAEVDEDGSPRPGTIYAKEFDIYTLGDREYVVTKPEEVTAKPHLEKIKSGEWAMVDGKTGEPVVHTVHFKNKEEAREYCSKFSL